LREETLFETAARLRRGLKKLPKWERELYEGEIRRLQEKERMIRERPRESLFAQ